MVVPCQHAEPSFALGALSGQTLRTTPQAGSSGRPAVAAERDFGLYHLACAPVLKTNNPVVLSYATHVLEEAGIDGVVFDTHASIMDGSMGWCRAG